MIDPQGLTNEEISLCFKLKDEHIAKLEAEVERLRRELNRQWEIEEAVILGRAAEDRGDHEAAEIYADNLTQALEGKDKDGGSRRRLHD